MFFVLLFPIAFGSYRIAWHEGQKCGFDQCDDRYKVMLTHHARTGNWGRVGELYRVKPINMLNGGPTSYLEHCEYKRIHSDILGR